MRVVLWKMFGLINLIFDFDASPTKVRHGMRSCVAESLDLRARTRVVEMVASRYPHAGAA
jgi:hypothetical protein